MNITDAWRSARSSYPPGYLNAASCNVPSDAVLDAVVAQLRREQELGAYEATPDLSGGRAALAALVDADGPDVAFLESATAAMAALLGGWALPPGSRIGVTHVEYGSTTMLLRRLAPQHDWRLVDLPMDGDSRLDPAALEPLLPGLSLVVHPHIASQRGVVQPAAAVGALCRAAGVPYVLDVCQSLGHVDVTGVGATAYVGTSRKWLAGPRGVGFLIVPGLDEATMDAAVPALGSHRWAGDDPAPEPGAARYETSEAAIAARVGLATAVLELHALGPAAVHAHLAALGPTTRDILDGAGGWRVVEPFAEPSAITTLRPPPGDDPAAAVERARALAAERSLTVAAIPTSRSPADMPTPVLRVSPTPATTESDLKALAAVLAA